MVPHLLVPILAATERIVVGDWEGQRQEDAPCSEPPMPGLKGVLVHTMHLE